MKQNGVNMIKIAKQKKTKITIFLDIDGVLSNWTDEACDLCDIDCKNPDIRKGLKEGKYLDKLGIISEEDMWKKVTDEGQDFWIRLKLFSWAKKLVDKMKELGDVLFLTSPGCCIPASSGKAQWVQDHFGKDMLPNLILCKKKEYCASKNTILVDDTLKKVEQFREAGGHAFLWPNQYSLEDGEENENEVIEKLIAEIKAYKS